MKTICTKNRHFFFKKENGSVMECNGRVKNDFSCFSIFGLFKEFSFYSLLLFIFYAGSLFSQVSSVTTYSSTGLYTWTAPSGVVLVTVEAWGGGGGGGGGASGILGLLGGAGGGGGGGSYSKSILAVIPGTGYAVGVGGGGGGGGKSNSGTAGNDSYFNSPGILKAVGGKPGAGGGSGGGGAGGAAGSGVGTTKYSGGSGATGNPGLLGGTGGGGGSSAGTAANGGNASNGTGGSCGTCSTGGNSNGNSGASPGAGGAGRYAGNGGNGGIGQVKISYTLAASLTISSNEQIAANICPSTTDVLFHSFTITGANTPANITQIQIRTSGNYTSAMVANMKLWTTGTSSTFSGATQLGSTIVTPGIAGTKTFSGLTYALGDATHYFWVTFDATASASGSKTIYGNTTTTSHVTSATSVSGSGTASGIQTLGVGSTPSTPSTNAATNVACTTFTANWNASSRTSGYFLDVDDNSDFSSPLAGYNDLDVGNVTTYDVTGLTAGGTYYYRVRADKCGATSSSSSARTVNVSAVPSTPAAPSVAYSCSPASATLTKSGSPGAGIDWFWQGTNAAGTSTTDNASSTYYTTTTGTNSFYIRARTTGGCWSAGSGTVSVTIGDVTGGTIATNQAICGNADPDAFTSTDDGVGSPVYEWQEDDNTSFTSPTVVGANSNVYDPPVLAASTYYRRKATVGSCFEYSNTLFIEVAPAPNIVASGDVTICKGSSTNLSVSGGLDGYYLWVAPTGLSADDIDNPVANPTTTTTYTVTGYAVSTEKVQNPSFESGNTGFTSDYGYVSGGGCILCPEGVYTIGYNAQTTHPAFRGLPRTGSNQMIINGSGTPGANVWCQDFIVAPDNDYAFSTWVSTLHPGDGTLSGRAKLQFSINGYAIGDPFYSPPMPSYPTPSGWDQFFAVWNSGSSSSATICVVNQNVTLGGNDFAFDDMSFAPFCGAQDEVTVTVPDPELSSSLSPAAVCSGGLFSYTPTSTSSTPTFKWTRAVVAGISNGSGSSGGYGTGVISETLINTTGSPINVTYVYRTRSSGCTGKAQSVVVTINPAVTLSSSLTPAAICSGAIFDYQATSTLSGADFSWTRATVAGITETGTSGTGDVSETLTNISGVSINVTYQYATSASGCSGTTENVVVSVKPGTKLSSTLSPSAVCSGTAISYTATSATSGATFSWSRAAVLGISNAAATGTGGITETLTNTSATAVSVTYIYTTTYSGCSNAENVVISIKASPQLNSSLAEAICSPNTFAYTPNSAILGATFTWSRATVAGLTPTATTGAGVISEALTNSTTDPLDATYVYTSTYDGCTGPTQDLVLTVNPIPVLSSTTSPAAICGGTTFTYTPTSATADATFSWSRAAVANITEPASTGTLPVSEILSNTSAGTVPVIYKYITTAAGCSSTEEGVTVNVKPLPILDSDLTPTAICSGTFAYTPTTATTGSPTYAWSRAAVTGITEAASTGTGDVNETLTNTTTTAIDVTYIYTVTESSCSGSSSSVVVSINPSPQGEFFGNTVCYSAGGPWDATKLTFSASSGTGPFSLDYDDPTPVARNEAAAASNVAFTSNPDQGASAAGTYEYVLTSITDNNGCVRTAAITTATATITVTNSVIVADPSTPASATTCSGVTASFFVDASGVQAYAWEVNVSGAGGGSYDETAAWVAVGAEANPPTYNGTTSNTLVVSNATTAHDGYRYRSVMTPACGSSVTSSIARMTVNVLPVLTSSLAPTPATCSGTTFTYSPTSGTGDATFAWSRAAVAGITEVATTGTGEISEVLTNTIVNPVNVTYVYTTTSPSTTCQTLEENVVVTINPAPILSSSTGTVETSCSPASFSYDATSGTTGSSFTWSRATIAGITEAGTTGTGDVDPAETLTNTSTAAIDVVYEYTSTANTCSGPVEEVVITVYPDPVLSSGTSPASICTSPNNFSYTATTTTGTPSYSWTRATMAGISETGSSGNAATINETLTNTTDANIDVVYVFTTTANACVGDPQNVTVRVFPVPELSSALTQAVCSTEPLVYTAASTTSGTPTFAWTRAAVADITSSGGSTGTGTVSETLTNASSPPLPIDVTYSYITSANGCDGPAQNVVVTVNPIPVFTGNTTPSDVCSETVVTFDYTATADVTGTTFAWSRAFNADISQGNTTGTGNVSEVLTNTSTDPTTVVYTYTPTYSGCVGSPVDVSLVVNPRPILNTDLTATICSGTTLTYTANSATAGDTYEWSRADVANITEASTTGTGDISEVLTNTTASAIDVDYIYTTTANNCAASSPETVVITVNPTPTMTSGTSATICTGTSLLTDNTLTFTSDITSTFGWTRANTVDIGPPGPVLGTSNPVSEDLTNVTDDPITTTYVVTPTSDPEGCDGASQDVEVSVTPVPIQPNAINGNPN